MKSIIKMKQILIVLIITVVLLIFSLHDACAQQDFPVGESFAYQVKWLGIPVGTFTCTVTGEKKIKGRNVFVVEAKGGTNKYTSLIFKIEDRFVSYIDKEKLVPLKFEVSRREGHYKKDAVTRFDHAKHKAYFRHLVNKTRKVYDIPPDVQDILSVFYRLRRNKVVLDEMHHYEVMFAETVFSVYGKAEKKKNITLLDGKRMVAFYTKPIAKADKGVVREGKVRAYLSADEYQVPLRVVIKAPIFTKITATLSDGPPLKEK